VFTGIVEDLGEVLTIEHMGDSVRVHIRSETVTQDAHPGDSICVNGVCLTVTALLGSPPTPDTPAPPAGFVADVMGETLVRSSLKGIGPGTKVNLERSVRMQDRLGGHLVQGHVDGTATILGRTAHEHWDVVRLGLPPDLARYVVHKGSIAVDGISHPVSALSPGGTTPPNPPEHGGATRPPIPPGDWFEVSLIPETLKRTTLGVRQPGDEVNLEVDVIAKYVEKLTGGSSYLPGGQTSSMGGSPLPAWGADSPHGGPPRPPSPPAPVPPEGVPDGKARISGTQEGTSS
jgi:riboflavin synthase